VENPAQKFGDFHWCTQAESDSFLLFQKWTKLLQDKWQKGHVALITKNMFWHHGAEPPGVISHIILV